MKYVLIGLIALSLLIVPSALNAKAALKEKPQTQGGNFILSFAGGESGRSLMNIVLVLTVLAFAPAILLLMSAFTRIVIVLSFLRQAMGIPQLPPNQIIIGLSLFLTIFIMAPTYEKIHVNALTPYMENKIGFEEFLDRGSKEMNSFMLKYTKEKDLALFMNIASLKRPATPEEIPIRVVVPAFAISELKRAFQIGFLLYIPFLMIDMVVASVLLSAGMMMLPPIFISLPFKLMLFVLVDGWNLLVGSIIKGFY
ncbi:MAG TPA: flagellar type III secretion system pore protein FliP [Syntrophorhabdaceae bacterium]|nr:flagellar type III secretion system pore protein FliP [Syntrophorhabdaceae bacterium]